MKGEETIRQHLLIVRHLRDSVDNIIQVIFKVIFILKNIKLIFLGDFI
jgi:hypothetical protein